MANILRYNPNDNVFDNLFRGFLMRPVRLDGQQEVQIKLDVKEGDQAYTVDAGIPGAKKIGIHVTMFCGRCYGGAGHCTLGAGTTNGSADHHEYQS